MKQEERGNVVPFTPKDARENAAEPAESAEAIELVDTHTHLNDEKFADDVPDAVARARAAGVTRCINMGDTLESSKKAVELAHAYEGLFAGVGIHPEEARELTADDDAQLAKWVEDEKVVSSAKSSFISSISHGSCICLSASTTAMRTPIRWRF